MENKMMERVEQLEEKVKRLEENLQERRKPKDKYCSGVRGRITVLIFGAVVVGPIIAFVITILTGFAEK